MSRSGDASADDGVPVEIRHYDRDVTRITLRPSPHELMLHREQYVALIDDLKADGYDVELVQPDETRDVWQIWQLDPATAYSLTVEVWDATKPIVYGLLISVITDRLRTKRRKGKDPARRGRIILPNGDEHEFDLPRED
jgi:hypothetical protein